MIFVPLHRKQARAGCSSARLEYSSGGRVVAGSNPVIPTSSKRGFTLVCGVSLALYFIPYLSLFLLLIFSSSSTSLWCFLSRKVRESVLPLQISFRINTLGKQGESSFFHLKAPWDILSDCLPQDLPQYYHQVISRDKMSRPRQPKCCRGHICVYTATAQLSWGFVCFPCQSATWGNALLGVSIETPILLL